RYAPTSGRIGVDPPLDYENFNMDSDPSFPNRLLWQLPRVPVTRTPPADDQERISRKSDERTQRNHNADEALALWGLETSESNALRKIATQLLAALTIFAIALYFLGQGFGIGPTRSGYALFGAGIAFGVYGLGSGLVSSYRMIGLAGFGEPSQEQV